jgi:uncharacterized protein RhaS with RHS repeats
MYYYGFRFYEPNLQRWINADPLGELGSLNLFRAVRNCPTGTVDPEGDSDHNTVATVTAPGGSTFGLNAGTVAAAASIPSLGPATGNAVPYVQSPRNPATYDGLTLGLDSTGGPFHEQIADVNGMIYGSLLPGCQAATAEKAAAKAAMMRAEALAAEAEATAKTARAAQVGKQVAEAAERRAAQRAAEKTAKKMAERIERDLGKEARREFHDMKDMGDRTLQQLKDDAKSLYDEYGKQCPSWMQP